jgi:hypothetical protein
MATYFQIIENSLFIGNIFGMIFYGWQIGIRRVNWSHMVPQQKRTMTESIELYKQTLLGKNYSTESIRAYMGDLEQFVAWLKTRRTDWDIPFRIQRIDIVQFINTLAAHHATAQTAEAETRYPSQLPQISKR